MTSRLPVENLDYLWGGYDAGWTADLLGGGDAALVVGTIASALSM